MAEECIICCCSGSKLAQCKDISFWAILYPAAVIWNHKPILEASNESKFPESTIKYHLKVKNDHRSKFSNLSNWKEEA